MKPEDPKAWLRSNANTAVEQCPADSSISARPKQPRQSVSTLRTVVHGNELYTVPLPANNTGFRDPFDHSNRSDKRHGGDYIHFQSSYQASFAPLEQKPVRFREDGIPISARRIPGKPLMAPKIPDLTDRDSWKKTRSKFDHQSRITIGDPNYKEPRRYKTVYKIVHTTPTRTTAQPNPGIASQHAQIAHKALGLYQ